MNESELVAAIVQVVSGTLSRAVGDGYDAVKGAIQAALRSRLPAREAELAGRTLEALDSAPTEAGATRGYLEQLAAGDEHARTLLGAALQPALVQNFGAVKNQTNIGTVQTLTINNS